ncbi:MAG TPA: GNAT family protein [Gemmatimonadaceae bacterium]|nr:GNAT family protein [Gemmatimonadaceae bacterium]
MTEPLILEGRHVRLEPLLADHAESLARIGCDPRIWAFSRTLLENRADVDRYIAKALASRDAGTAYPFITLDRRSGEPVGSTRFENMELAERRVEIGWSWLAPSHWRSPINTEAKYLMLRHAFEVWQCVRVEFKVLVGNERSLKSITNIGATQEGVLRKRLPYRDGSFRDVTFLSMLDEEWPPIRARLEARIARTQ